jgi:mono/diheme cytochrome c family protein
MRRPSLAILIGMLATAGQAAMPGVENPARARQHYILQCQGCHRPDATGTPATTPTMANFAARFLSVSGGREYLSRVPGVATAALSDKDLAELLNWTLIRFDPGNMPADFKPYDAAEVARLRHHPLRTDASTVRQQLVAKMEKDGGK